MGGWRGEGCVVVMPVVVVLGMRVAHQRSIRYTRLAAVRLSATPPAFKEMSSTAAPAASRKSAITLSRAATLSRPPRLPRNPMQVYEALDKIDRLAVFQEYIK